MWPMVEPTKVWAVRVGVSDHDAEGVLRLEEEDLVFDLAAGAGTLRLPLRDVTRARRVRGSPVLVVDSDSGGKKTRFAFFFVKPPPLHSETGDARRKVRRKAVTYLQTSNAQSKDQVKGWEAAVRAAVRPSS